MATNTISANYHNSVIGGGACNLVDTHYAGVFSGCNNTVSGRYSSILGGACNTVSAAYSYAGVFGCNVSAVASNTFHVECLNACATPLLLSQPLGTLTYINVTPAMVAIGFPAASKIAMIS